MPLSDDARTNELLLLAHLRRSAGLRALGCTAFRGLTGSVIIALGGTTLGVWWFEAGEYCFGRVAWRNPSLATSDPEEALSRTIAMVSRAWMTG
jgi:hypothetical protein